MGTYLFLLLLAGVNQCSSQRDTCSTGSFRVPVIGSSPCPPPAFPDWNNLFSGVIAALGRSTVNQVFQDAEAEAHANNISTSFCLSKVNVSYFNSRLATSNPLDVDSICSPTTPITSSSTVTTTKSTLTTLATTISSKLPLPAETTTFKTTLTSRAVQESSTRIGVLTSATITSSINSTGTVKPSGASLQSSFMTTETIAGDDVTSKRVSYAQLNISVSDVNIAAIVVPIVVVALACTVVFTICYAYRNNERNQHVNFCKDLLLCHWRRKGGTDTRPTPELSKHSTAVTFDIFQNRFMESGRSQRKVLPVRAFSTNSATLLIRTESALSGETSTDDFPAEITTETAVSKSSYQPALEPVSESTEPVSSSGRRTDPTHRRAVADVSWQRTLPSTRRVTPNHPSDVVGANIAPRATLDNLNTDLRSNGRVNIAFQSENEAKIEKSLTDKTDNDDDDDDDDEFYRAVWEKFDEAVNTAVEVEMGSQMIADLNNAYVTSVTLVEAPPNQTVELI